jgi:hypothetical protein
MLNPHEKTVESSATTTVCDAPHATCTGRRRRRQRSRCDDKPRLCFGADGSVAAEEAADRPESRAGARLTATGCGVECGLRPSTKHAGGRAHGERSVAEALQRIKEGRDARSSTTQAVAHGTVNVMVTTWHLTTMRRRKRTDGPVRLYSFHTPGAPSIERCIALRCVALPAQE